MAVGYDKNKSAVDAILGDLSVAINRNFRRAVQLKTELDAYTDGQLTNAGYTVGEVASIRTFVSDLAQLQQVYSGAASLPSAKDFRPALRPFWGVLGDF